MHKIFSELTPLLYLHCYSRAAPLLTKTLKSPLANILHRRIFHNKQIKWTWQPVHIFSKTQKA
jgi:hypothetical protein